MTAVHRARRGPDRETAVRPLDPCLTGLSSGTMPQAAEASSLYRALGPASNPGLPTGFPPGPRPAPEVCPKIVGQLQAGDRHPDLFGREEPVLPSGQTGQIWDTPVPGGVSQDRRTTARSCPTRRPGPTKSGHTRPRPEVDRIPKAGYIQGQTPYRKRRRTGGVGPGPAPREAGEGGSPLRTPGLNGPGSRRTNGAGTALSSPGRSRHRYPGGGDRKPALPVPAKEWGWPTNPLVPPARGFLFPAAGLRRVAPRAIRRPSLIEGRALFLSALRRSKGGFHLERSGECDA